MENVLSELYSPSGHQMVGGNLGNAFAAFVGGKKASKGSSKINGGISSYEDVAYPEYIKNEDWKLFIESFYLIRKVINSKSSSIYVIPPHDKLEKMIKDFEAQMKKEGINVGSPEAAVYASNVEKDFEWRRCIFKFFGDSDPNHFRIQSVKPAFENFGWIKRTNELNEQFLFKYIDGETIGITPELDETKDLDTGSTKCKVIAKCLNNIYVFQGDLPKAKVLYESKEGLNGGNINESKINYFMQSIEKDPSAESFVSSLALAAFEEGKDIQPFVEDFSGNLIHAGFRMCFDSRISDIPNEDYDIEDIRKMTQRLQQGNKLKSFNSFNYVKSLENIYSNTLRSNLKPVESTKKYVNSLKKFYKNNEALMEADIATALYQNLDQTTKEDISRIFDLVREMENPENGMRSTIGRNEYEESSDKCYSTSRLNAEIHDAIQNSPLIGLNAKTYSASLRKMNLKHKVDFDSLEGGKKKYRSDKKNNNKISRYKYNEEAEELPLEEPSKDPIPTIASENEVLQGGDDEFAYDQLI